MTLLEREDELATIEAVLTEGGVLVIEGGPGIGKTSLVTAAAAKLFISPPSGPSASDAHLPRGVAGRPGARDVHRS